jgi:hypothetical protein
MKSMYQSEPKEQDGQRNSPRAQEDMKHNYLRAHPNAGITLNAPSLAQTSAEKHR